MFLDFYEHLVHGHVLFKIANNFILILLDYNTDLECGTFKFSEQLSENKSI